MNNFENIKNFSFEEMALFLKKVENGSLGDEFCAEVCERRNSQEDCDCPYLDDSYIEAYLKAEAEGKAQ